MSAFQTICALNSLSNIMGSDSWAKDGVGFCAKQKFRILLFIEEERVFGHKRKKPVRDRFFFIFSSFFHL